VTLVRLSRIFSNGAAAVLVAAAFFALVAVLRGHFSDTDGVLRGGLAVDVLPGERLVLRRRAERGAVTCDR
jgi:hypothetical protein